MTNFNIQIISDSVCPWCYVGLRRLSRAITTHKSAHPSDTFTLSWAPFYLNPAAAAYPGVNKREFYDSKFGASRTGAILSRLSAVGEGEGIAFKFGGQIGRTRDSHRVIWLAGEKEKELRKAGKDDAEGGVIGGLQTRVVERLFRVYFEEEKNITDREVLVEAGVGAGLDRKEVEGLLDGDVGGKEVDEEAEKARRQLITGVPYYLVQGQYAVEGADEPATFLEVFERVKGAESS
ncbi:Putative Thioredoxin [Aspergillus calidoustus]|uniref:Putative Thioredoxin n=1 Tax=Aspergillus calidoustus TaxID=454130 RepID=A0A0U5GPH1_ASPCI|nr:Putative Thioredoxin [Aspergillus calidoustus]